MRLLGVVVLTGALLTAGQAHASPPRAEAPAVTLITGDQVLTGQRAVRPAPGREHILFTSYTSKGHEFVVPNDAMPFIADGRLDERLFDITELQTYDGALPVIVTYPEGTLTTQAGRRLPSINGVAFDAAKTQVAGLRTQKFGLDGVKKIWLDAKRQVTLDRSVKQIGAPAAHAAGYTGQGTTVAVLDTGVDQTHPDLNGAQLKARLTASTTPGATLTPFEQGAGRVDVAKLIRQNVTSEPASISFGAHRWPHTGKPALTKEITYTNAGTEPVTLDLTTETGGAVFAVSPAKLTVPAKGTAKATVTADITKQPGGGVLGGAVVTSGTRTAVVIDLEKESYDVTFTATERSGARSTSFSAFLINVDTGARVWPGDTGAARLQKGRYVLSGSVQSSSGDYTHDAINYPNLTVTGQTTIELDARKARPVQVKLPTTARLSLLQTGFERVVDGTRYTIGTFSVGGAIDHLGIAHLGPDSPEVTGQVATFWVNDADFYGLAWYRKGSTFTGLTKTVAQKDLATVKVDMPPLGQGQSATIGHTVAPHGRAAWTYGSLDHLPPGPRTEYYGGEGADWSRRFNLFDPSGNVGALAGPLKHYRQGRSYVEPFHRAVFGPALPEERDIPHTFRTGDLMRITVPLYGDSAGNAGYGRVTQATTTLFRDNVKVGGTEDAGWGLFEVAPGAADYRVVTDSTRDNPLSSKVSGVWTFRSDTTAKQTALPLSVVRFTPRLDDDGAAPAGRMWAVPVSTQSQTGSVRITSVEVSYDGGTTWRATPVSANRVLLAHPQSAKSVSLRAKASGDGQTVEQTIVNAYLLKP